jgi:hypothetical protein
VDIGNGGVADGESVRKNPEKIKDRFRAEALRRGEGLPAFIAFLGALGVLAVKNLITARFAQDAKSAKKYRCIISDK